MPIKTQVVRGLELTLEQVLHSETDLPTDCFHLIQADFVAVSGLPAGFFAVGKDRRTGKFYALGVGLNQGSHYPLVCQREEERVWRISNAAPSTWLSQWINQNARFVWQGALAAADALDDYYRREQKMPAAEV